MIVIDINNYSIFFQHLFTMFRNIPKSQNTDDSNTGIYYTCKSCGGTIQVNEKKCRNAKCDSNTQQEKYQLMPNSVYNIIYTSGDSSQYVSPLPKR